MQLVAQKKNKHTVICLCCASGAMLFMSYIQRRSSSSDLLVIQFA